ncbi:iron-sulfur cluster repair di-iron protein [soil metagenome]
MKTEIKEKMISEMVTEDFRKAGVFRKYGIDFCCGGNKTLQEVAAKKKLDLAAIEADLSAIENSAGQKENDASDWKVDYLCEHIVNIHHNYVRNTNPNLIAWSEKVALRHGDHLPYLLEVRDLVKEVVNELDAHMMKEEHVLFPYITNLALMARKGEKPVAPFGSVANPIKMMENEHVQVGEMIQKIQDVTNNYTPPLEACNTFRILFQTLKAYEEDLFLHIHLENNILFPKAIKLETEGKE